MESSLALTFPISPVLSYWVSCCMSWGLKLQDPDIWLLTTHTLSCQDLYLLRLTFLRTCVCVCVSAHLNQEREKRVVFLTARVHPGESPASFICQGKTLSRLDTHIHSPMMSWDPVICWDTKHWPADIWPRGFIRTLFLLYFKFFTPLGSAASEGQRTSGNTGGQGVYGRLEEVSAHLLCITPKSV